MPRSIGFTALNAQDNAVLKPQIDVQWSERYLGRPVLRFAAEADDHLAADRVGVVLRGAELLQLKSDGLTVRFQARNAATLAVTLPWTMIAAPTVAGRPVALMQSGSTTLAVWTDSLTTVRYRTSTDGGRTWAAAATLHTAGAGNSVYALLQSAEGAIAVEERVAGSTARLHTYAWGAGFSLIDSVDTGALAIAGGSVDANDARIFFAGDFVEATVNGTVTIRRVKVYALGVGILGTLHQGVAGGVRWRDPLYIRSATLQHYVLAVLQLPRGSGDLSDRVNVYPWSPSAVDALFPLGPPRAVYAVEDSEGIAVVRGAAGLYIMAGSHVTLVAEASTSGSLAVDELVIDHDPEDEQLAIETPGTIPASTTQLRARLGFGGDYVDMGLFWLGSRVGSGRDGAALVAYGLWGVLRRELQQMSCELLEAGGKPMTPGKILQLVFTGLGFTYSEAAGLTADLHPAAAGERLRWALRYGEPYSNLVRSLLRWTGCEARAGVAAGGTTPTITIFRPGSRFGPSPVPAKAIGGAGQHPTLAVVSVDPERASDATVLPGGWDHQTTLDWYADRQLVVDGSEAYGVTSTIRPATRALARSLASANAGELVCRPCLEVELWDTISVTDTAAGLSLARRLVNSASVVAGRGRWEMRLHLGLE